MKTPKQVALEMLEQLPDDVSLDVLISQLHFRASVFRGLAEAERGEGIDQEELERRLSKWLESSGRQRLSGT